VPEYGTYRNVKQVHRSISVSQMRFASQRSTQNVVETTRMFINIRRICIRRESSDNFAWRNRGYISNGGPYGSAIGGQGKRIAGHIILDLMHSTVDIASKSA